MGERFKFEGSVKRDIQSLRSDNVSPTRKSSSKRQRRYQRPEHIFDPEEDPKLQATLLRERRAMLIITAISIVCIFLFLVAMATNYWLWAIFRHKMTDSEGQMVNVTTQLWIGIWNEYRQRTFDNGTQVDNRIAHFPTPPEGVIRLDDIDLKHYYRTQAVFSVISLLIMIAGVGCAIYSMKERRYMYKRLTAGLHAFSAMSVLVVIEVMVHHVSEWRISAKDLTTEYGFSTIASWIVFAVYLIDVFVFIICSRKRKGSRAGTVEYDPEDRPMELGR